MTIAPHRPVAIGLVAALVGLACTACGGVAPPLATAAEQAAMSMVASAPSSSNGSASGATAEQMDAAMKASIAAFPARTQGTGGGLPLAPIVLPDGTKQFHLTAEVVPWEVSPGKTVQAWTYNGVVPGPMIHVNVGDKVAVVLHNALPESTSIHFHGIQTPFAMDGTTFIAQDPVKPGQDFTYSFTPTEPAVGMYHSHHDAVTQVPNGLEGAFLVGDMPTPAGVQVTGGNQPFVLDDAGTIGLSINGKSFPATVPFTAQVGQWIEVTYFNEGIMIHPMHLHEFPQLVIAKDGNPLPQPYKEDVVTVAPGERWTVLIHVNLAGTWVWHCHILPHAENDQGMFGMVTALIAK
jgi:FtsP/CotA-like multicopper oxidase with cupredoxin domain